MSMSKQFFCKHSKNADFDADFESAENIAKNAHKKVP
jgi:hypothetical protein